MIYTNICFKKICDGKIITQLEKENAILEEKFKREKLILQSDIQRKTDSIIELKEQMNTILSINLKIETEVITLRQENDEMHAQMSHVMQQIAVLTSELNRKALEHSVPIGSVNLHSPGFSF